AHRRLGRGHREHEEDDELPGAVAQEARVGDQRKVDRVEHQLDRQEEGDAVPAGERPGRADGEEERREQQVPGDRNHWGSPGAPAPPAPVRSYTPAASMAPRRRATTVAPITATSSSRPTISNASRYSVNSSEASP